MTETQDSTSTEALIDRASLRDYLSDALGPSETFEINKITEGHSNETFEILWGDRELVLRRPPAGETSEKAHDVLREFAILDALQETRVPVPGTVLSCEDEAVLGCDFYVMEKMDGRVIREEEPEAFGTPSRRRQLGEQIIDVLANIHRVDVEEVGLGDFGHPEGFLERQVSIWNDQWDWAHSKTSETRPLPGAEPIGDWLSDSIPEMKSTALVHGDYKIDNVMFAPEPTPRINAVFDWEMSTLGDPLTDLGLLMGYWRDARSPASAIDDINPAFLDREGYPTRGELVERYENKTGIDFENRTFYRVLGLFKLAGACEMFYARYLVGDSERPFHGKMETVVPELIDRAQGLLEGEDPLEPPR